MKFRSRRLIVGISIFFSYALLLSILTPEAVAKRFSSDVPKEVQAGILELDNVIGIDIGTGIISKSYSDHMIDTLLGALNNQYPDVKHWSLTLLAEVIKQFDVPKVTIVQAIKPAIDRLIKDRIGSTEKADIALVHVAKRVLWQVKFREISDDKKRLEFLKDNIENTLDGNFYYSFEALDWISEIGTDEAKNVLLKKLSESTKRSIPEDIIDKLNASLEKLEAIQVLKSLDPLGKAKRLKELISKQKKEKTFVKRELLIWMIRHLGQIDNPEAVVTLKDIWQDSTYQEDYRYEAQEVLVRLKKVKPEERKIIFQ